MEVSFKSRGPISVHARLFWHEPILHNTSIYKTSSLTQKDMLMLQCPCHLPVSSCPIDALTHWRFFEFCQDIDVHAAPMCALAISRETHTIVTISRETHTTVTISRETHATVTISRETNTTVTISQETLVCSRAASCDTVDSSRAGSTPSESSTGSATEYACNR